MNKVKKNKGGRPRKLFTDKQWGDFEKLCQIQCTKLEICDWFDVEDDTLEKLVKEKYNKGFSEVFELKKGKGRIALRRRQWQLSETNVAMAIFLGKNWLNQSDRQDVNLSGDIGKITFEFAKMVQVSGTGFATSNNNKVSE